MALRKRDIGALRRFVKPRRGARFIRVGSVGRSGLRVRFGDFGVDGGGGAALGVGVEEPALGFEFLEVVVAVREGVGGVRGVAGGRGRPLVRVAVRGGRDELDVGVSGHGALFAVGGEGLGAVGRGAFGDADDGGDEPELLVHDGAGHGGEEFGDVGVVGPLRDGAGAEDGVEVLLEAALGGRVEGEVDEGEVDAVGGCFVACEDEDEGVAQDFAVREGLRCRVGCYVCVLDHGYHEVVLIWVLVAEHGFFLLGIHFRHILSPFEE